MNIIKAIALGSLLLLQGISFCAQAEAIKFDQLQDVLKSVPDTVTLKCTDGVIPNVPVSLLIDKFGYFEAYFRNWGVGKFAYSGKEVVVDGTVHDMSFLLSFVNPSSRSSYGLQGDNDLKTLVLLELAHWLCLKEEEMNLLIDSIKLSLQKELYSKPAYKNFLEGDRKYYELGLLRNLFLSEQLNSFKITDPVKKFGVGTGNLMLVYPDGKFIMDDHGVLKRYNSDGNRDTSFSSHERGIGPVSSSGRLYEQCFLQPDGKIVVLGRSLQSYFFARYNSNGMPDTTFGNGGTVIIDFGRQYSISSAQRGLILPNGGILVAGVARVMVDNSYLALAQYNSNGTLDANFGIGGIVTTSLSGAISKVLLQPDGKIIVAAPSIVNHSIALVRYNQNGILDSSFGTAGIVTIPGVPIGIVFLQEDGHILVKVNSSLLCYDQNGRLDVSFGSNGRIREMEGTGFVFSDDGTMLASSFVDRQSLYVYDTESGKKLIAYLCASNPHFLFKQIKFCPDGKSLMVHYYDTKLNSSYFLMIPLPLEKINKAKLLQRLSDGERYLYRALTSLVEDAGHKLDTLSLPEELQVMFDTFPRILQDEIITTEGPIKRDLVRDVQGVYGRMRTIFGIGKEPQAAPSVDYTAVD